VSNSAEVKKFVASNPDAIGYIDRSALDASVKAVLKID
jgi:ABC-type phosphate transport system substrate-binding protein